VSHSRDHDCPACEHPLEHHGAHGCRAVRLRGPQARAFQAEDVVALVCPCELSEDDAEKFVLSLKKEREQIDREIDEDIKAERERGE